MDASFSVFFLKVVLMSAVLAGACYWAKRQIFFLFTGFIIPLLLAVFFFLLPQVGVMVSFLVAAGVLFLLTVALFLFYESSSWFRGVIKREQELGERSVNPAWPLLVKTKKEGGDL